MTASQNYVLNKNFREPYIHYTKEGYKKQTPNISGMQQDALSTYKNQSRKLRERFRRNEMSDKTEQEAAKAMKTIDAVLEGFLKTSAFKEQTENINVFKDELYRVDGKSFWSFSQKEEKRAELFQSADMLADFVEKLGASLETFRKTSKEEREAIMSALESKRLNIPTKDALSHIQIIKGDSKADIGLKKLIASVQLLEGYVGPLKNKNYTLPQGVPRISEPEAMEIVRTLAGSLNGLKGGFFEVAVNELGNNMTQELLDEITRLGGTDGSITITGSEMAGTSTVQSKSTNKKVVSKTDIKMTMEFAGDNAKFNVGLSLKTSTPDSKTGLRKTTIVSGANYGDLLRRAGAIVDESTYHIANIAAGHESTSSSVYRAAKMKTSALLALEALSGLGDSGDTAYYVLYTDKVLNIATFLDKISKGDELPLDASLEGIGGLQSQIKAKASTYAKVDRYIRSRDCLRLVFDTIKVTMKSSSKG